MSLIPISERRRRRRRYDPDGNERLTSTAGLALLVLGLVEVATVVLGLRRFLSWHVFVGLALLPPVALKLVATGWRFQRYYLRNEVYRAKGAPQLVMRLLAPLLVAATVLVFGSGVALGLVHGQALVVARRIHGPASVAWMILVGAHVLVYLRRALQSSAADVRPSTRPASAGARVRTFAVTTALAAGAAIGVATLPAQHHWLHLPPKHDHERSSTASPR